MLLLVLAAAPLLAVANCVNKDVTSVSAYVSQCLDPAVYQKEADPPSDGPTEVQLQFKLTHLDEVEQINGFVSLGGYFRQWWKDGRLAYNSSLVQRIKLKTDELVWRPDIYIENVVEFSNPSKGWVSTKLVDIFPDGSVRKSKMAHFKMKCAFTFHTLPFDRQDCKIVASSYSKNASFMRVFPREGRVGPGTSGLAIVGEKIPSSIWNVMDGTEFALPGHVQQHALLDGGGVFDKVEMPYHFSRWPGYYRTLVLVPSSIFLLITYTGFFITCTAVPARGTLAVTPVLIMLTLLNIVYKSMPQNSQITWLATYLLLTLMLAVSGVIEFGVVQKLLEKEAKAQKNLETLLNILPVVKKVRKSARDKNSNTLNLVSQLSTEGLAKLARTMSEDETNKSSIPNPPRSRSSSPRSPTSPTDNGHKIKEADVIGLNFIASIFQKHDFDSSNQLSHKEVCTALSYFNIWLCWKTTATAMCMFLRDSGEETPAKEEEVTMGFGKFTEFLLQINSYLLKANTTTNRWHQFLQSPPSLFIDVIFRWLFPVGVVLVNIIMLAATPA